MYQSIRNNTQAPRSPRYQRLTDRQALEAAAKWGLDAPILDQCTQLQWARLHLALVRLTWQAQDGLPIEELRREPLFAGMLNAPGLVER